MLLACGVSPSVVGRPAAAQEEPAPEGMFSGTVTAVDEQSLTAVRGGPGQGKAPTTKTFLVTPETRFEGGKPRVNARVTVRYVSTEAGDRAIHVIVRGASNKK